MASFMGSGQCHLNLLSLSNCRLRSDINNHGMRMFGMRLSRPTCTLQRLYVEDEPALGDQGIKALLIHLQLNTSITSLGLRHLGISDESVRFLATTVLLCRHSLRSLSLNANHLTYHGVEQLLGTIWDHLDAQGQQDLNIKLSLHDQDSNLTYVNSNPSPRGCLDSHANRVVLCLLMVISGMPGQRLWPWSSCGKAIIHCLR